MQNFFLHIWRQIFQARIAILKPLAIRDPRSGIALAVILPSFWNLEGMRFQKFLLQNSLKLHQKIGGSGMLFQKL